MKKNLKNQKANWSDQKANERTNASNKKQVNNQSTTKVQRVNDLEKALDNIWLKTTDSVIGLSKILKKRHLTLYDVQGIDFWIDTLRYSIDEEMMKQNLD